MCVRNNFPRNQTYSLSRLSRYSTVTNVSSYAWLSVKLGYFSWNEIILKTPFTSVITGWGKRR
jgi:hypothetical protein